MFFVVVVEVQFCRWPQLEPESEETGASKTTLNAARPRGLPVH